MIMSNAQQIAAAGNLSTSPKVEVTAFHRDLFKTMETARKAAGTRMEKMTALLRSKYGAVAPTFAQFKADRAALKLLADEKGLTDDQWVRKPYNAAVKLLYGALPEAQTAAAIAKRKVREATAQTTGKAGAKKGETAPRRTSTPETIEQFVARVGVFKVLDACAAILGEVTESAEDAKLLRNLSAAHQKAA
jgi:hypothetical protein